jgi:UDP-N-acetylglucosamine diphosphorylase/glucosamine-1-phosphate N-acetyltransferase
MDLLPFTFTRPVASIRVGILTLAEKWENYLERPVSYATQDYLQDKFPMTVTGDNLFINGAICPDPEFLNALLQIKKGGALIKNGTLLATRLENAVAFEQKKFTPQEYAIDIVLVDQSWKIFQYNGDEIRSDFEQITRGRKSKNIEDPHTRVYAGENIFIENGATIQAAILNATNGPIYIGHNVQVQEGAIIRGPFSIGDNSIINMGAKMRGDTTIGPDCKVGGEISNAVIFGNSSKVHDGFLGSSVIGEWCNMGADTNTSNMKNNYDAVKLWNYSKQSFKNTGLTFCGLMMGDHSKCGINTMFNTGTVTGVSANIFGAGYPRNFIPSFAWGGPGGFITYQLNKVYETASKAMERRSQVLTPADKKILKHIFDTTAAERVWEAAS